MSAKYNIEDTKQNKLSTIDPIIYLKSFTHLNIQNYWLECRLLIFVVISVDPGAQRGGTGVPNLKYISQQRDEARVRIGLFKVQYWRQAVQVKGSSNVQHGLGCFVLSLHSLNILNNLGNKWYSIKITFNVTTWQVPSKCDNYRVDQFITTALNMWQL